MSININEKLRTHNKKFRQRTYFGLRAIFIDKKHISFKVYKFYLFLFNMSIKENYNKKVD